MSALWQSDAVLTVLQLTGYAVAVITVVAVVGVILFCALMWVAKQVIDAWTWMELEIVRWVVEKQVEEGGI